MKINWFPALACSILLGIAVYAALSGGAVYAATSTVSGMILFFFAIEKEES